MQKKIFYAEVLENREIAPEIMEMVLKSKELSEKARPGQFINIYPDPDRLILPRPFGIHNNDAKTYKTSIIYEIIGEGTRDLSEKRAGDVLKIAGPLGNGFDLSVFEKENGKEKTAMLIGGGAGTSVLLFAAERLAEMNIKTIAVLGFREYSFGAGAFERLGCTVFTATDIFEEGSFNGNVCECMEANGLSADCYMACGPEPMLRAVAGYADEHGGLERLQVSMDGRMGCGYGVCLGCSISVRKEGAEVRKRVCADGPVFYGNEVIW